MCEKQGYIVTLTEEELGWVFWMIANEIERAPGKAYQQPFISFENKLLRLVNGEDEEAQLDKHI